MTRINNSVWIDIASGVFLLLLCLVCIWLFLHQLYLHASRPAAHHFNPTERIQNSLHPSINYQRPYWQSQAISISGTTPGSYLVAEQRGVEK